jgi:hypothetical protein
MQGSILLIDYGRMLLHSLSWIKAASATLNRLSDRSFGQSRHQFAELVTIVFDNEKEKSSWQR